MRILFLINSLGGGGAERVLVNLVNRMDKSKFEITVRTLVDSGVNRQTLSPDVHYEKIFSRGFRGLNFLDRIPGIYRFVAHGDYDIIVVYLHGVLTRIVSKASRQQKTIAYLHANMENSPFMQQIIKAGTTDRVFAGYNRIVAVSKNVADSFVKMTGSTEKVCVKYNTFDVEGIREAAKDAIELPSRNQNEIRLCSIGKIEDVKGFLRMIPVLSKLRDQKIGFHWIIVGDGNQRKKLEQEIAANHLDDRITLAGYQENPYKFLSKSDLLVCSSFSEGFSSVVAESLILGVPVITTDCNGMREMLGDHNEYGIIVENSGTGLYNGLYKLLTSVDMIKMYRERAKQRGTVFMPESTVKSVEKMLEEVYVE